MAFSWQESVKPAGTQDIQCDIEYLDKSYIHVYLDGAETTAFTWTSSTNIRLNSPLSAETVVLLIRKTAREYLYIEFASGAPFIEGNVDTQNTQFLHLAQELVEGRSIEGFYGDINMHRYRITNLGDPVDARDAANKQYVDAGDARLDQRIDAEHAAWVAAVDNEASIRKAADDALDVRTTNLEQTYFNANTNSFPWWTVLTTDTDTVTPGMPFTKAKVRVNGVTQTAGYSYDVIDGSIKFTSVLPAGTLVDCTIGIDTEADTSALANILAMLSSSSGAGYIGTSQGGTVQSALDYKAGSIIPKLVLWFITPEQFGAVGDGVTDDIAALNSAAEYAANLSLPIYLGPKTYATSGPWILPDRVKVVGVEGISRVLALSSWDDAIVKSRNAPAGDYLTVNVPSAMVNSIYIEDLIIEGGWDGTAENTRSHTECLRIYGAGTNLKGIRAGYCRGVGVNLGGRGNTSIKYMAPSKYSDIRVDMVGQHGIVIGGSSDNQSDHLMVRSAGLLAHNTYDGIRYGGGGGARGSQMHVWAFGDANVTPLYSNRMRYGLYVAGYDTFISNCHFEGAASAQVYFEGARNSVINTRVYSNWQAGAAVIMANDANMFHGFVGAPMNSTPATEVHALQLGTATASQVKNCSFNAYVYGCKFINYVGSAGRNIINIQGDLNVSGASGVGTIITGSIPTNEHLFVMSPQYSTNRLGANLTMPEFSINAGDVQFANVNASGLFSADDAVSFPSLTDTVPTVAGRLYRDANGFVKVKM